ncbi:MAG: DoxX family protein [Chitinophagales bacterium]
MKSFFDPAPIWQKPALGIIRIIIGIFMVYHGLEVFEANKIREYAGWDSIKSFPAPMALAYLGKLSELIGGILLVLGLFTRLASLMIMVTMLFIAFVIGHGKIWYEDQYPFLFGLLALVIFFNGPGAWSLDQMIFKNKTA